MTGIIVSILVLSLVIIIHELGHFITARRAGILCHEFSLGMGPVLWSKKYGETVYAIRLIPLGGYVAMAGEEVNDELVKVGNQVRVIFNQVGAIVKIVLDHTDEAYEEYELITVEKVDLKGINDTDLYINDSKVERESFYIIKGKDIQVAPANRNFNYKNKRQRFLAIFGGPFMNFVLAFFVFILYAMILGFPVIDTAEVGAVQEGMPAYEELLPGDIITSIDGEPVNDWDDISLILDDNMTDRLIPIEVLRDGTTETVYVTPIISFFSIGFHSDLETIDDLIIGEVPEGTQASNAGMQKGDQLVSIDGETVSSWFDVTVIVERNTTGLDMDFVVLRDGITLSLNVEEPWNEDVVTKQGFSLVDSQIGIAPNYEFNLGSSLLYGFTGIKDSSTMIFDTLSLLFGNDQVGAGDLAGPVGIYQITSSMLSQGFLSLLGWVGLLSVNLGVINLLPIPALDGGRLVFLGWEAITGKKANQKIENTLHYAMYIMLMGLFLFITYNDILRLLKLN